MAVSPTARNHAHQQSGTTRVSRAKAGSEKQVEIANGELDGAVPDQMVRRISRHSSVALALLSASEPSAGMWWPG